LSRHWTEGGEEARSALVEVLRAPQFSKLHYSVVVFLPRIHSQESVPVLVGQLSSGNPNLVIRAILGLQQLQARSAMPDLVRLLHHRNATVRLYAASSAMHRLMIRIGGSKKGHVVALARGTDGLTA
jgi:hypothetical protein